METTNSGLWYIRTLEKINRRYSSLILNGQWYENSLFNAWSSFFVLKWYTSERVVILLLDRRYSHSYFVPLFVVALKLLISYIDLKTIVTFVLHAFVASEENGKYDRSVKRLKSCLRSLLALADTLMCSCFYWDYWKWVYISQWF
jgi:hypothetical protein